MRKRKWMYKRGGSLPPHPLTPSSPGRGNKAEGCIPGGGSPPTEGERKEKYAV